MNVIGIIPCRYQSSRFPGKPITHIHGKPMLWHVWSQSKKTKYLNRVIVATDSDRIYNVSLEYGIETILTSDQHKTGTDRVSEVAKQIDGDIFINIQGDEPLIDPSIIDKLIEVLINDKSVDIVNAFSLIENMSDIVNSNIVKVVTSAEQFALAFSRSPIPHPKQSEPIYKRQIGLYAFRNKKILKFSSLPVGYLENAEGIEMYRYLENGYPIKMVEVDDRSIPVDVPGDIARVEKLMTGKEIL